MKEIQGLYTGIVQRETPKKLYITGDDKFCAWVLES